MFWGRSSSFHHFAPGAGCTQGANRFLNDQLKLLSNDEMMRTVPLPLITQGVSP